LECWDRKGRKPLQSAIQFTRCIEEDDMINVICVLLDKGANMDSQDNEGLTILHNITRRIEEDGSEEGDSEEDDNEEDDSEPGIVVEFAIVVAQLLLDRGADMYSKDNCGKTH
jgi:hypothetical protein